MEQTLSSKYDPKIVEDKWYKFWLEQDFFSSVPDNREPYCIVIPPPNVTGVLHMGHMLNNTIQDVLVRRARMKGKNACWVPGTDHASIATEARVVAKLKAEGIEKSQLTREEFLKHAWEWKEKHGGIILEQLKKLGTSCDWKRTKFTMDDDLYESVIHVFVDLYNKGLIYRGVRMINWDPQALTAVSDEEVIFKETDGHLYYVKYKIADTENEYVTIATTRPETILGDTAVCVNPNDERYKHLYGKFVFVPLINRKVPVILDEYVDMEFGTGCLKITPAHDYNDYLIGQKYNLPIVDIFNDNATLNENAQILIGLDRMEARKQIVKLLNEAGLLEKIEPYKHNVGYSERTNAVIEPKLSTQWFLRMQELAKPALEVVMNDEIKFHPPKFKNLYRHWMENVKDWCISRQLWWGHRIPAYYLEDGRFVVAKTKEEALKLAQQQFNLPDLTMDDLKQDEDVLDTWFSSWLWPLSVFDGIRNPDNPDFKYYYPTDDLVTAPEILFFWVARMIMAGLEYTGKIPFKNVYFTGIVRDKAGRKMSKSLGNSPEPLELIDKYGADGVRLGLLLTSPAGNDLPFDEELCVQGRNFNNKIWNALRLVKSWQVVEEKPQEINEKLACDWFENLLAETYLKLEEHFTNYRISDAAMLLYRIIWEDFCSWFLEIIKPYDKSISSITYNKVVDFFENLMLLLHPFMPFITEEIWQNLKKRNEKESIMTSLQPIFNNYNNDLINEFEQVKEIIVNIRNLKSKYKIPVKQQLELFCSYGNNLIVNKYESIIHKLTNTIVITKNIDENRYISFRSGTNEFIITIEKPQNSNEEINKLQEEIKYYENFLENVRAKLSNEKFLANAPSNVIEKEKKKESDIIEKIKILKKQLEDLQ